MGPINPPKLPDRTLPGSAPVDPRPSKPLYKDRYNAIITSIDPEPSLRQRSACTIIKNNLPAQIERPNKSPIDITTIDCDRFFIDGSPELADDLWRRRANVFFPNASSEDKFEVDVMVILGNRTDRNGAFLLERVARKKGMTLFPMFDVEAIKDQVKNRLGRDIELDVHHNARDAIGDPRGELVFFEALASLDRAGKPRCVIYVHVDNASHDQQATDRGVKITKAVICAMVDMISDRLVDDSLRPTRRFGALANDLFKFILDPGNDGYIFPETIDLFQRQREASAQMYRIQVERWAFGPYYQQRFAMADDYALRQGLFIPWDIPFEERENPQRVAEGRGPSNATTPCLRDHGFFEMLLVEILDSPDDVVRQLNSFCRRNEVMARHGVITRDMVPAAHIIAANPAWQERRREAIAKANRQADLIRGLAARTNQAVLDAGTAPSIQRSRFRF